MSIDKDKENKIDSDFGKEHEDEIDPIVEANESLTAMNSDPFDKTLEIMSQTLASIDNKIEVENSQLQKLDQLSEIKGQLNRIENINLTTVAIDEIYEHKIKEKKEEKMPQSSITHNQQETPKLLEKIEMLEKKISTIENEFNNSSEKFKKIESVVNRFEDLESELPNLFKNLFQKKKITKPNEKILNTNKLEIQSESLKTTIPKDTESIIEEAEDSLENITNETLILENTNNENSIKNNFSDDFYIEDQKPKSNNLKYGLWMVLPLCTLITILFFINKNQIIDLHFDEIIRGIFFLIDKIFKKFLLIF